MEAKTYMQSGYSGLLYLAIVAVLGYFVYGGIDGALAMVLVWFILGLCIILAMIPFVGIVLQWWVSTAYVIPFLFELTGIGETWLTTVTLIIMLAIGILVTIVMSFAAITLIYSILEH
jgi:hypothetical protein